MLGGGLVKWRGVLGGQMKTIWHKLHCFLGGCVVKYEYKIKASECWRTNVEGC